MRGRCLRYVVARHNQGRLPLSADDRAKPDLGDIPVCSIAFRYPPRNADVCDSRRCLALCAQGAMGNPSAPANLTQAGARLPVACGGIGSVPACWGGTSGHGVPDENTNILPRRCPRPCVRQQHSTYRQSWILLGHPVPEPAAPVHEYRQKPVLGSCTDDGIDDLASTALGRGGEGVELHDLVRDVD
jgi:hypothetical protein